MSWPFSTLFVADAMWFGAGFLLFALRSRAVARGLLPTDATGADLVAGLLRFLGGLNLALAALCAAVVADRATFTWSRERGIVLLVVALAHLSQVAVNVPFALEERAGGRPPWRVLRGLMLLIFCGDFVLGVASLGVGVGLACGW